ncbi:MAG: lysylphosphatidylglycerol synthase transmembrane domain-containing protein [Candidatus Hermodarchaeota archaeon]
MRSRYYYIIAIVSLILILVWLQIALVAAGFGGIGAIFVVLSTANLFWLLPAITLFAFAYVLRAIRWWVLLRPFKTPGNPANLYPMLVGGIFLTYVAPLRAGDLATPYWLREKKGTRFSAGLASIVLARFLDFSALIIIIVVSVFLIYGTLTGAALEAILVPILLGVIFIVFFILIRNDRFVKLLSRLLGRLFRPSERLKAEVPNFVENFADDLRTDVGSWNTGWALFLSVPLWMLETMKLTFLGLAFGVEIPIVTSMFVAAISYIGGHAVGLLLPAGIAIFLFQVLTLIPLLGSFGIPGVVPISIALLDGLIYIIGFTIMGVPSIATMGREYRELQEDESLPKIEENVSSTGDG